jgi:pyruvate/2-oxoglutarate dehydrogenase complex dihydrolipoamide dehydrogenase (E3) component
MTLSGWPGAFDQPILKRKQIMKQHFDLIAIGGGSGGLAVAEQAARYGKTVAVVEAARMGGTCVNNGCVPKKVMWYAANLAHAVDDANGFGIPASRGQTDWAKLVAGRQRYIGNINP